MCYKETQPTDFEPQITMAHCIDVLVTSGHLIRSEGIVLFAGKFQRGVSVTEMYYREVRNVSATG
jgi:hypothetical protein